MKRKFLLPLIALCALVACQETEEPNTSTSFSGNSMDTSESGPTESPHYYLTGDLDLGNQVRVELLKQGDTYTYGNVKLKRGNSLSIYSSKDVFYSYDALTNKDGFEEGKNGHIRVLNEGVYDVSLNVESTPTLTLTKKDSTYSKVVLKRKDGQEFAFTKNEDFTFTLNDVDLRYRDQFYIDLDGEHLKYTALDYNDVYYDVFRFKEEEVYVVQKGTFDFTLDFSKANPLLCTSDILRKPVLIPENAEEYRVYVESLEDQFTEEASDFTLVTKEFNSEGKEVEANRKSYEEHFDANQYYAIEIDGVNEEGDNTLKIRNNYITETNYFELQGSFDEDMNLLTTTTPSVTGYLLGEAPKEETDSSSTIRKIAKNYVTEEDAVKKLHAPSGSQDPSLKDDFLDVLDQSKLLSNKYPVDEYLDKLELDVSYREDYGDGMSVKARNIEMQTNHKNIAFVDEVEFLTDNEGHVNSGKITFTAYGTSSTEYEGGTVVDEEGNFVATEDMIPTKVTTYEFSYKYEERKEIKDEDLLLAPEKYIASYIECSSEPISMAMGGAYLEKKDLKPTYIESSSAMDAGNYQVMEYDSKYLSLNWNGESFTLSKAGTTKIVVGNVYNDVTDEIILDIDYNYSSTSISLDMTLLNGSSINYTKLYIGGEYDCKVTASTGYDPSCKVVSSDPESIEIIDLDDEATQKAQGEAHFKIKVNKALTSSVTLTATSTVSAYNIYGDKKIEKTISPSYVLEPLEKDLVANTYVCDKNTIELKSDGTGIVTIKDEDNATPKTYNFTWKYNSRCDTILLDSSDDLSEFTCEFTQFLSNVDKPLCHLDNVILKDKEDNSIEGKFMNSVYPSWEPHSSFTNMTCENGWTLKQLEMTLVDSSTTLNPLPLMKLSDADGTHTIEFVWKLPTSSYKYGEIDKYASSFKVNGVHPNYYIYGNPITITEITDTTMTITISEFSSDGFANGTYTFTQVQKA